MKKENMPQIIKAKPQQQLNQREANLISEGAVEGVLRFASQISEKNVVLTYDTNGLMPLGEFLGMNQMNKRLFVVLLRNITLILKSIDGQRLSKELLMWSVNSSYVEPASWRVYMMYVPLQPYEAQGNLKAFLLELVSKCSFESGDIIEYVRSLVQELNGATAYTVGMLEAFCNKLTEGLLQDKKKSEAQHVCPSCNSKLASDDIFCPFCGKKIDGRAPADDKNSAVVGNVEPLVVEAEPAAAPEQISVNEDENGVVTVFRNSRPTIQNISIEDCATGERIMVQKFPFRIGKMQGVVDFRIYNNAVSRKHADIIREENNFFVIDLGSTNGTFVNGIKIQTEVKTELADGAVVRFANADFKIIIG